jgi:hypothetical protein
MNAQRARRTVWFALLSLAACGEPSTPDRMAAPSFAVGGVGRPAVLVNPNSDDNGTAKTIQEGIEMVAEGGMVMVLPGMYTEAVVIDKGLTLEAVGGESGPVIVAPPGTADPAIRVATPDPVVIRGLTVQYTGLAGIRGVDLVDLTIEQATVMAVNPPLGQSSLIVARTNDARVSGGRARLVVRNSTLDGAITDSVARLPAFAQVFGITVGSDIDATLEGNVIRHTGGACILLITRPDLAGETNAEIVGNDLDQCHPFGRVGAILAGPPAPLPPGPRPIPVTATGTVNVVGNTIHNSSASCLAANAIHYEFFTGRIERNRIFTVVQPCALPNLRTLPGAIWVGAIRPFSGQAAAPVVRFNDIEGNAQAGLRVASNITAPIDASCNWWGSASGPSGVGLSGTGDAVVVEAGGAAPVVTPYATAPIAGTGATSC